MKNICSRKKIPRSLQQVISHKSQLQRSSGGSTNNRFLSLAQQSPKFGDNSEAEAITGQWHQALSVLSNNPMMSKKVKNFLRRYPTEPKWQSYPNLYQSSHIHGCAEVLRKRKFHIFGHKSSSPSLFPFTLGRPNTGTHGPLIPENQVHVHVLVVSSSLFTGCGWS